MYKFILILFLIISSVISSSTSDYVYVLCLCKGEGKKGVKKKMINLYFPGFYFIFIYKSFPCDCGCITEAVTG
jgi:hypothetical protein